MSTNNGKIFYIIDNCSPNKILKNYYLKVVICFFYYMDTRIFELIYLGNLKNIRRMVIFIYHHQLSLVLQQLYNSLRTKIRNVLMECNSPNFSKYQKFHPLQVSEPLTLAPTR